MTRRELNPDYSACFGALAPSARETVRRFTRQLGIPEDSWPEVPTLRRFVLHAAVLERAAAEEAEGDEALRIACAAFRIVPSASALRQLRRWRAAGQSVRAGDTEAA